MKLETLIKDPKKIKIALKMLNNLWREANKKNNSKDEWWNERQIEIIWFILKVKLLNLVLMKWTKSVTDFVGEVW